MENKTTTELIDLLTKLVDKGGNLKEGYEETYDQLKERKPFFQILNEDFEDSLPALNGKIEDLEAEIKKLKRHKHDDKSGDVLIRI